MRPIISIITPVYNTGAIMMETVASVLQQKPYQGTSVPEFELIIVDDHSTDPESTALLAQFAALDNRIKVVSNEHHKGVSGARNTGIDLARGDWLAFLDSDDLLLPHSLAYRWAYVSKTSAVTWLATPFHLLKDHVGLVETPFSEKSPVLYQLIKDDFDQGKSSELKRPVSFLCSRAILGVSTLLIKTAQVRQLKGFNESFKRHEDFELWCRLAAQNDLHHLPLETSIYRIRPGSLTHNSEEPTFFGEELVLYVLMKNPLLQPYLPHLEQRLLNTLLDYCYYYRKHRAYVESLKWSLKLVIKYPKKTYAWKILMGALLRR